LRVGAVVLIETGLEKWFHTGFAEWNTISNNDRIFILFNNNYGSLVLRIKDK
jgi:hypothetical protein